jgi:hypothetical protein
MNDTTLTEETGTPTGDQESLPVAPETEAEVAAEQTETEPQPDPDLEWAKTHGIDPDDPEALKKALKIARDNQRETRADMQAQKNLQKELIPEEKPAYQEADPQVAFLNRRVTEMQFYQDNPEAKGREDDIIAVAKDYPELGQAYNLQALWEIAKGRAADAAVKAAEKKGSVQARQEIAKASVAGTPKGNASETRSEELTEDEARLERFKNW